MSPAEFAQRMAVIVAAHRRDTESRHINIDFLMETALRQLGYGEGIDLLDGVMRWYA